VTTSGDMFAEASSSPALYLCPAMVMPGASLEPMVSVALPRDSLTKASRESVFRPSAFEAVRIS